MDESDLERRNERRGRARRRVRRQRRTAALIGLLALAGGALAAGLSAGHGARSVRTAGDVRPRHEALPARHARPRRVSPPAAGRPAGAVPILVYHVIAPAPRGAPFPGLYVPPAEFAAQMRALARAGYRAVTLDQLERSWSTGSLLPRGRPVVVTFDNGYRSQYTQALPVLRRLGWVGVENLQLTGLPPRQGGLSQAEVRALVSAGWELDTQGFSHADLPSLDRTRLRHEVAGARVLLRRRYGVPVDWFCYPSGQYDDAVIAMVRGAGYVGATTVVPGWAEPGGDRYRLPRLRVLAGTTPATLLRLVAGTRDSPPPPPAYG